VMMAGSPGRGLPPINDISTDLIQPPTFRAALHEPANEGRDMSYPDEFVPLVREAYPDIAPIWLEDEKSQAYRRARDAALALGWEISFEDEAGGTFEAQQVSSIFRFVDDIVVRVSERKEGTVIDLRSKSRDGRGDLGVNAERIRAFAGRIEPTAPVASE
ncbi:MAG: DUF1499 domain-containing protein, partial [Myxococcota bacterium]